ncbi:alpha-ketoglutarate-dependent dioxygenase AlkB [Pyruvatibacter sp.]|uniref:alpha-ketoglutarate-dependent dioxygenase AlkB n=1 Tax=Pyruvatibacter sp. TaxID=1981328 RepID=UPI003263EBE0
MSEIQDKSFTNLPAGAALISEFVSSAREAELLEWVDCQNWRDDLRRRVQHYGWVYDYRARHVSADAYLGPLPPPLRAECGRLGASDMFDEQPSQIIVNEYEPGQGIAPHIDCVPCFGPVVASLSLGSPCEIVFGNRTSGARLSCMLEPRSLLVLGGPARFEWTHTIPARKSDMVEGVRTPRKRRVSLTYRTVLAD